MLCEYLFNLLQCIIKDEANIRLQTEPHYGRMIMTPCLGTNVIMEMKNDVQNKWVLGKDMYYILTNKILV